MSRTEFYVVGAVVNYYELEYSIMNENGDETYSGTSSTILIDETSITVENLMPGTVYNFKTKVDPVCRKCILSDLAMSGLHIRGRQ